MVRLNRWISGLHVGHVIVVAGWVLWMILMTAREGAPPQVFLIMAGGVIHITGMLMVRNAYRRMREFPEARTAGALDDQAFGADGDDLEVAGMSLLLQVFATICALAAVVQGLVYLVAAFESGRRFSRHVGTGRLDFDDLLFFVVFISAATAFGSVLFCLRALRLRVVRPVQSSTDDF